MKIYILTATLVATNYMHAMELQELTNQKCATESKEHDYETGSFAAKYLEKLNADPITFLVYNEWFRPRDSSSISYERSNHKIVQTVSLMDFPWELREEIYENRSYGTRNSVYYLPLSSDAKKSLNQFEEEIENAGFSVNDSDKKEIVLTPCEDYILLFVNELCLTKFLSKFPLANKEEDFFELQHLKDLRLEDEVNQ